MKGAKPLSQKEIDLILGKMTSQRNRSFLILALKTGYRISELLSLTTESVVQYGKIRDSITVARKSMKGKVESRTVVLHKDAKKALEEMGVLEMELQQKLFPFGRIQANRILKEACAKAKVEGRVSMHSTRKTFAKKVFNALGKNIVATQKAMGHKNINSTISYLSFEQEEIDKAILGG